MRHNNPCRQPNQSRRPAGTVERRIVVDGLTGVGHRRTGCGAPHSRRESAGFPNATHWRPAGGVTRWPILPLADARSGTFRRLGRHPLGRTDLTGMESTRASPTSTTAKCCPTATRSPLGCLAATDTSRLNPEGQNRSISLCMDLTYFDRAAQVALLAKAVDLDEVKSIHAKAEACESTQGRQKNRPTWSGNAVIRLRAERRMGELLAKTVQPGNFKLSPRVTIRLSESGNHPQSIGKVADCGNFAGCGV